MIKYKEQTMAQHIELTLEPEKPLFCLYTGECILSLEEEDLPLRGACFMIYVSQTGMESLHEQYRKRWQYILEDPNEENWGREREAFMESFDDEPNVVFIEVRDGVEPFGVTVWLGIDVGLV